MPDRLFSTPRLLVAVLALTGLLKADVAPTDSLRHIPVAEYRERVAASWLGQIVGNIYGLSYEFRFLEEPGPDRFPYGYGATLERELAAAARATEEFVEDLWLRTSPAKCWSFATSVPARRALRGFRLFGARWRLIGWGVLTFPFRI